MISGSKLNSRGAYWFLAPYFLLFTLFFLIPAITIIPMSFTRWSLLDTPVFVGIQNYTRMFADKYFLQALRNTFYYTFLVTIELTMLGLFLAMLLNLPLRGRTVGRVFVIMPYVISSAVAGVVWT